MELKSEVLGRVLKRLSLLSTFSHRRRGDLTDGCCFEMQVLITCIYSRWEQRCHGRRTCFVICIWIRTCGAHILQSPSDRPSAKHLNVRHMSLPQCKRFYSLGRRTVFSPGHACCIFFNSMIGTSCITTIFWAQTVCMHVLRAGIEPA